MRPEPEKRVRSEMRENLQARCADCQFCHGKELVTIWHDRYTGEPYLRLRRTNGAVKAYALRVAVPCVCPLGTWVADARASEDATAIRAATVTLLQVLEGTVPWSMTDPTAPPCDEGQAVEPGDFRRMIDNIHQIAKQPRKLLRERVAASWKSLPPTPNVPAPPVAAEVPEEELCDIPF